MPEFYALAKYLMQRSARVGLLGLCVFSGLSLPLSAEAAKTDKAETAKDDLDQIKEKIQQLSNAISASRVAKQDAHEALKASESAISESRKKLREIQEAQQRNREHLSELQKQMSQLQREVGKQQQAISQQLNQQYRHGNTGALQLLLQQQDPADAARKLKYLGYLTAAHQSQIQSLQVNQEAISRVRAETAEQVQETDALAKQYNQTTQKLEQEKTQRSVALSQLSKHIETQEQQLARLKKDEEALSQLFQKLVAAAKKREQDARVRQQKEAAAKRAAELATKKKPAGRTFEHAPESRVDDNTGNVQNNNVIAKNETLPEYNAQKENFAQLRGRLRLPVRGEVINRFGSARADTGVSWKGLFIRAREGSEVKSVAGGEVVFANWMRGFGNLIVIDHGNGYMSLYGNNEALYKSAGQAVKAGDTIAAVGNSGGNAENGVYYELRRNSIPFDPLQWSSVR